MLYLWKFDRRMLRKCHEQEKLAEDSEKTCNPQLNN